MNDEAKTYLDTALDFIQDNALKSGQIGWPATREEVYQLVDAAQTPSETYPAIELVLLRSNGCKQKEECYNRTPLT